ncbi:oligosaccharide flippase family protein [Piscinibacter sp. XHJ-5]|uniref:oligosaccharide flippase family protein n=1 Tax=Piscinibacter sp. XHJ-5 TaxID=3037797 RepID=UPI00245305AA|nr:oligosaccharide flippase family protein [Piscinibacter sp. XHJ-5]
MTQAPRLAHTLPQVYAAAAMRLLLPLVVLPLVASRVGPQEFGRLSFILVWASLLSMIVEGGFLAAATRLAVGADHSGRWRLAQQVFTARCVLCVPAALLAAVAVAWAGDTAHPWADGLAVAALACALGWPATWYLQATQQLSRWARVELVVYGALLLLCWTLADSVAVFVVLQLLASASLAVLGWWWLRRDLAEAGRHASLWDRPQLAPGLRLGWTMMPVAIAGAAYSFALPAAASVQMAKAELGLYFMADRIVRALLAAADPVFSVVYPRIVTLFRSGTRSALRYALRWAAGGATAGALLLLAGMGSWPLVESLLAPRAGGIELSHLQAVMQVLGWLLPLLLGWKFIGYWMLGSGRYDTAYRSCMVVGGIVGVIAAATVGGAAGAVGLAWTALGVEAVVIAVALGGVWLTNRHA